MRLFRINNKVVTKHEWQEAYKRHPDASVILRLPVKLGMFVMDDVVPISLESLQKYKRKAKQGIDLPAQ